MLDMIYQFYGDGMAISIIVGLASVALFFIVGMFRFFKRYAYAQPMCEESDDATDCSFVLRIAWAIDTWIDGKPVLEDKEVRKPIGAMWQGAGLDMLLSGVFFLLVGLFWPVVLPCAALYFPIQSMHVHHKRKKEFLKKLQGEEVKA